MKRGKELKNSSPMAAARVANSVLGNLGENLMLEFGEKRDLSEVQCHRIQSPGQPFSLGDNV